MSLPEGGRKLVYLDPAGAYRPSMLTHAARSYELTTTSREPCVPNRRERSGRRDVSPEKSPTPLRATIIGGIGHFRTQVPLAR